MSESDLIQKQREILRAFRAANAQRMKAEVEAEAQQKTRQRAADASLNETRQQASSQMDEIQKSWDASRAPLREVQLEHFLQQIQPTSPTGTPNANPPDALARYISTATERAQAVRTDVERLKRLRESRTRFYRRLVVVSSLLFMGLITLLLWELQPCQWLDLQLGRSGCPVYLVSLSESRHTRAFRFALSYTFTAFSIDGKVLAAESEDMNVKLWDTSNGRELRTLPIKSKDGQWIEKIRLSPDSKMIAIWTGPTYDIQLIEISSNRIITSVHSADVDFSPDSKLLAVSNFGTPQVTLFELSSGRRLRTFAGIPKTPVQEEIRSVTFSPDGKLLAAGGLQTVWLWDIATGREVHRFDATLKTPPNSPNWVDRLFFSPDGTMLVAHGYSQGTSATGERGLLWDTGKGQELFRFPSSMPQFAMLFSTDSKQLIFFNIPRVVAWWDIATKRIVREIDTDPNALLAISPDGRTLASASEDGTIKLWRVK